MAKYFTSDFESPMSQDQVSAADRETQLDVMETWFRQHFENPAEITPFESAEGGYIWIWGGPYEARDELDREFSGVVVDETIDEIADKLEGECPEWAPILRAEDYDDYLVEDIAGITDYYQNFSDAIVDIKKLHDTKVDDTVANCLWRLLYANAITALETYLSDAFISTVVNNPELMRRFIETTPRFKAEKIPLSDVFKEAEKIKDRARRFLINMVWHRLERVKPMYRETLGIGFPSDLGAVSRAILKRHDIVHRNGKTKDREDIPITYKDIADLTSAVEEFVKQIETQLAASSSEF